MAKVIVLTGEDAILAERVQAKIEECYQVANEYYGEEFPLPEVMYDLNGQVAGYASYKANRIRLNYDCLVNYSEDMINQTVPHEVAHLIAYRVFMLGRGIRIKPHGWEWRSVCGVLGIPATRCHSYEVKPARKVARPYVYSCACREWPTTRCLHKRMERGHTYTCNDCRTQLRYEREE